MSWKTENGQHHAKNVDFLFIIMTGFGLIGLITQNSLLFMMAGIFISYFLLSNLYEKKMTTSLHLDNPKVKIRLFPGEEARLSFTFHNTSIFPLVNGELQFKHGPAIKPTEQNNDSKNYWNEMQIPTTIMGRRKIAVEIPITAKQRGTTGIHHVSYTFPHLFLFDSLCLKLASRFQTEYIVLPRFLPVEGMDAIVNRVNGEQRVNSSPFEDIQSPIGTRDYSFNDPFHRINWKASVKTQQLQTNIYEKTADLSFVFIVNLDTTNNLDMEAFNRNLETLLSYTAYLCRFAKEKGISYEIFLNARRIGKVPYFHMHEGVGKVHYLQSLEMLARVDRQAAILPFNQMLHRIGQQLAKPTSIIFIGEIPSDLGPLTNNWRHKQQSLFHITSFAEGAVIHPWGKGARKIAK